MHTEPRIVDNRVLLLGLDEFYRHAMQEHERRDLLDCVRRVAKAARVAPLDEPVEGYYADDQRLTEYFCLVRALQTVDEAAASPVTSLPEFKRLRDVMSAPLYGRPQYKGKLLPEGRDALSQALLDTRPRDWAMTKLLADAHNTALRTDDISLVGLAARIQDALVLAAVRESVVLYAEKGIGAAQRRERVKYIWKVDEEVAWYARRFVDTFNAVIGEELPPPDATRAETYWRACHRSAILGRCVRLGYDNSTSPVRHYHWAICRGADGEFAVQEFWKPEVWTTARYRSTLRDGRGCPEP